MPAKVQIIFYSMYGHVYQMAEAVAAGVREAGASEVSLWQVPELVPDEILEKSGSNVARAAFAQVRAPRAACSSGRQCYAVLLATHRFAIAMVLLTSGVMSLGGHERRLEDDSGRERCQQGQRHQFTHAGGARMMR